MYDYYPEGIINFGMKDASRKAPVSLEVCWVMQHWKEMGWDIELHHRPVAQVAYFLVQRQVVGRAQGVGPQVNRWLKQMGYRFVLRKFTYPAVVQGGEKKLEFTSWWENKEVAPCYHPFRLALRLAGDQRRFVLPTGADIRTWLPRRQSSRRHVVIPAECAPPASVAWPSQSWMNAVIKRRSSWPSPAWDFPRDGTRWEPCECRSSLDPFHACWNWNMSRE